jgi:hypothetical protein
MPGSHLTARRRRASAGVGITARRCVFRDFPWNLRHYGLRLALDWLLLDLGLGRRPSGQQ